MNRRELLGAAVGAPLVWLAAGTADAGAPGEVEIANGRLRGGVVGGVEVFKGIPYGASTGGQGRFRPPGPAPSWSGVRDALTLGDRAPQHGRGGSILGPRDDSPVGEDCLSLNVWTPATDGGRRPVMVWLHGGGFSVGSGGSAIYDGTRLARRGDVVVVTVNHRLNVFGFLYLAEIGGADFALSGNAGMLDIVGALRWVRDNIAAFGGDPGNVTIFGESGGGGKVSVLMGMPDAAGLFHRAIVQSGSHLTGLGREEATANAHGLMKTLALTPGDIAGLLAKPMDEIVRANQAFTAGPRGSKKPSFSPVEDGLALPRHPWLPEASPAAATVPLMVGSTRTETTLLLGPQDPSTFALDEAGLRAKLAPFLPATDVERAIAVCRASHPKASPSELYFLVSTDRRVRQQGWVQAEAKVRQGQAPAFVYELTWDSPVAGGKWMSPHGLDLGLMFDNVALTATANGGGPEAQQVADAMSEAWITFARAGDPSTPGLKWPAYDLETRNVMLFDTTSRVAPDWRGDERRAIEHLPPIRVDR